MSTPDNIATNSQSPRKTSARWLIVALIPIVAILTVKALRPTEWRPDLHLKNVGTSAVTILYHDQTATTSPGETWRKRVRAGETIVVRAGTNSDAPSATITLPARDPKPGSSIVQRWSAEVNADDAKNIRFENRFYADVTDPPTPPLPWP